MPLREIIGGLCGVAVLAFCAFMIISPTPWGAWLAMVIIVLGCVIFAFCIGAELVRKRPY